MLIKIFDQGRVTGPALGRLGDLRWRSQANIEENEWAHWPVNSVKVHNDPCERPERSHLPLRTPVLLRSPLPLFSTRWHGMPRSSPSDTVGHAREGTDSRDMPRQRAGFGATEDLVAPERTAEAGEADGAD